MVIVIFSSTLLLRSGRARPHLLLLRPSLAHLRPTCIHVSIRGGRGHVFSFLIIVHHCQHVLLVFHLIGLGRQRADH